MGQHGREHAGQGPNLEVTRGSMQRMWEVVFEYVLYRIDGGLRLTSQTMAKLRLRQGQAS